MRPGMEVAGGVLAPAGSRSAPVGGSDSPPVIRPDWSAASLLTTSSSRASDQGRRSADGSLDLHHFLLLHLAHVFHLLDLIVGELLDLLQGPLLFRSEEHTSE